MPTIESPKLKLNYELNLEPICNNLYLRFQKLDFDLRKLPITTKSHPLKVHYVART